MRKRDWVESSVAKKLVLFFQGAILKICRERTNRIVLSRKIVFLTMPTAILTEGQTNKEEDNYPR